MPPDRITAIGDRSHPIGHRIDPIPDRIRATRDRIDPIADAIDATADHIEAITGRIHPTGGRFPVSSLDIVSRDTAFLRHLPAADPHDGYLVREPLNKSDGAMLWKT